MVILSGAAAVAALGLWLAQVHEAATRLVWTYRSGVGIPHLLG